MSTFASLCGKELKITFLSPIAFVVLFFFWLLSGLNFWWLLVQLADGEPLIRAMQLLFGGLISISLLVVVPLITMRLIAEERKLGTFEALLTSPVSSAQLVLAKFFATMAFYALLWLPVLAYVAIERRLAPSSAFVFPDMGAIRAGFFGVMLVGALYVSVGLFASSLTSNQIVAAISGFAVLSIGFFSWMFVAYTAPNPSLRLLGEYLSSYAHLLEFSRGVIDGRSVTLYLSYTAWFLFAATKMVEIRRK